LIAPISRRTRSFSAAARQQTNTVRPPVFKVLRVCLVWKLRAARIWQSVCDRSIGRSEPPCPRHQRPGYIETQNAALFADKNSER
jgi:hypothetical protein